jgi:hypothetical protein
MNLKMEGRAPHPGPLPIGSADAEREKCSPPQDIGTRRVVQGFKARTVVGRILTPALSLPLCGPERE